MEQQQYVTDTMAIVSYLGKRKLPISVKQLFQNADVGLTKIFIPSIVFVEIGYLFEKGRIDVSLSDVLEHISAFSNYFEKSLSIEVIVESYTITDIPELHDRLISGTAKFLNLELITNDPIIQASSFVKTVW